MAVKEPWERHVVSEKEHGSLTKMGTLFWDLYVIDIGSTNMKEIYRWNNSLGRSRFGLVCPTLRQILVLESLVISTVPAFFTFFN